MTSRLVETFELQAQIERRLAREHPLYYWVRRGLMLAAAFALAGLLLATAFPVSMGSSSSAAGQAFVALSFGALMAGMDLFRQRRNRPGS